MKQQKNKQKKTKKQPKYSTKKIAISIRKEHTWAYLEFIKTLSTSVIT